MEGLNNQTKNENIRRRHIIEHMLYMCELINSHNYPCDRGSGKASRPPRLNLPGNHALPRDDSDLKHY